VPIVHCREEAIERATVSAQSKARFTVRGLRNLILVALTLGVAGYSATMFTYSRRVLDRFGPQVQSDLEWRAVRGAQELARACDVGLVVGDQALLVKAFGAYATSSDVQAIVAVNATGVPLAQHGDLPEPLTQLFRGKEQELRAEPGYLVSWANAVIEGASVGRVAIVISTRRLTDANVLLSRVSSATLLGGAVTLVLGILVISFFTQAVVQRDRQLSEHAANLERKVVERTYELDERNRGMRLVLDNVTQGLLTIDLDGRMANERSAVVDRWFGPPEAGANICDYLAGPAPTFAESLALGLSQMAEGVLPFELTLDQMPGRFTAGGRTFDVLYSPVGAGAPPKFLLVIFNDVTEHLARERADREQKDLIAIFQRILIDRVGVEEFLAEATKLVKALGTESDRVVQRRLVHTLKGNSAMYGLATLADLANDIETQMAEHDLPLTGGQRALLGDAWREVMARVEQLLGNSRSDQLEIRRSELDQLLSQARSGAPATEVVRALESWTLERAERRLELLGRQARELARRLGKVEPLVAIDGEGVRLDGPAWASFWSAMVHAVRNAVDHGLEDSETRVKAGKPAAGRIALGARRGGGQLTFWIEDDGRGVDWNALKKKAAALGRPHETREALVETMFADGVSTRKKADAVSGRGVGLAALRQAVRALNGAIAVDSTEGRGTVFRFTFDAEVALPPEHRAGARLSKRNSNRKGIDCEAPAQADQKGTGVGGWR
jgi:signal transduction histidine kinase